MRGSTRVPPERPVLRLPGTDNSAHQRVAKQPRMLIGTANPGGVTLLCMLPYLWTEEPMEVSCTQTQITAERYSECALANKRKIVGQNFPDKLTCGPCWTNGGRDRTSWVRLCHKQFIVQFNKKRLYSQAGKKVCKYLQRDKTGHRADLHR